MVFFFLEGQDALIFVDAANAEAFRLFDRHRDGADGQVGALLDVELQHLGVVHLINVVAGEDQHELRLVFVQKMKVLEDGIGGAGVPTVAVALLGRHGVEEFAQGAEKMFHPVRMCSSKDWLLYWVRRYICLSPELTTLERVMSMMR